ncbi:hypothetical protein NDU88_009650 [Pleurodeles waltl]|uniref:Uncharacterized protein n=1 Tax=Pleurodeles waltl TaxID=8319 RepID=A0AAV7PVW2_PLEWA|nr:hypothetical protein NDU88_009650 [Pleurodeles waltl]
MVVSPGAERPDGSESGVLRRQHSGTLELVDQASRSPLESWRHIEGLMGSDTQRNTAEGTLLERRAPTGRGDRRWAALLALHAGVWRHPGERGQDLGGTNKIGGWGHCARLNLEVNLPWSVSGLATAPEVRSSALQLVGLITVPPTKRGGHPP